MSPFAIEATLEAPTFLALCAVFFGPPPATISPSPSPTFRAYSTVRLTFYLGTPQQIYEVACLSRDECFQSARKPNTIKAYSVGAHAYIDFCRLVGLPHNNRDPSVVAKCLSIFIGWLVHKKCAYGTVRVYVFGISAMYRDITLGILDPVNDFLVQACLSGAQNLLKSQPQPKMAFLFEFFPLIKAKMAATFIDARDFAGMVLAFFALLRKAELLALRWKDILALDNGIKLWIPQSKTSPEGVFVHVAARSDCACPKQALASLIKLTPPALRSPDHFVFTAGKVRADKDHKALTHSGFVKRIEVGGSIRPRPGGLLRPLSA